MDTVQAAHLLKLDMRQFLSCEFFIYRAQCGLHHAARCAEDGAGSAAVAQWGIKLAIVQLAEVDVHTANQFGQLNSRD